MRRKERGQALIITVLIFTALVAVAIVGLMLSTLYAVRNHSREALQISVTAGSAQIDYASLADGQVRINETAAEQTTREVFRDALGLETYGLASSPEDIAAGAQIEIHNDVPWAAPDPPYSGATHQRPTVAASARVPVWLLLFSVEISVNAEAEVNTR